MKIKPLITALAVLLLLAGAVTAQGVKTKTGAELLSKTQTDQLFIAAFRTSTGITYTIFRTYKYADRSGTYYVVLTESRDKTTKDDTINRNIRAFNFKSGPTGLTKVWEMKDFIIPENKKAVTEESTIWFWTKYCLFKDLDGDGLVDPVIVYGTFGLNGFDDGRVKILLWYKGKKIALRRQNSTLDGGRNVESDAGLEGLPKAIKSTIYAIDAQIEKDHRN